MEGKQLTNDGETTLAVIFENGDNPMAGLESFAREHQISAAHFTAIGAFCEAKLAYFDWEKKGTPRFPAVSGLPARDSEGSESQQDGEWLTFKERRSNRR